MKGNIMRSNEWTTNAFDVNGNITQVKEFEETQDDQFWLNKWFVNDRVALFDRNLFPNGWWSYNKLTNAEIKKNAFIFHANYIGGGEKKKKRMREYDMWLLDD